MDNLNESELTILKHSLESYRTFENVYAKDCDMTTEFLNLVKKIDKALNTLTGE